MTYLLYVLFGVLPSIIWLLFYLRKDQHPEPNRMILLVFFWGAVMTLPSIPIEIVFFKAFATLKLDSIATSALNLFIGVAVTEELFKYLVVRKIILKHPEFDEPLDFMLYMVIAALGFAAAENVLVLLPLGSKFILSEVMPTSIFRFLGATFLHTLCSGTLGFFLALSFRCAQKKTKFFLALIAFIPPILLHGLYNFSIIEMDGDSKILVPVLILSILALFTTLGFKSLKNIKSICKIKM